MKTSGWTFTAALLIAVFPATAAGQSGVVSAPIDDIRYEVIFTALTAANRQVATRMNFTVATDSPVVLSLPAWTPGSYTINDFARNVSRFTAEQGGSALKWDKTDHDSWRVFPRGPGGVIVSFEYKADSLENDGSWSRPDFLLFNGTNLFLYPEGGSFDFPAAVTVTTERQWRVVTGMTSTGQRTYSAGNYHDLVDMPFFVGVFDVDSVQISGKWMRLATYPVGSVPREERSAVFEALQRVVPPQVRVFGDVPWNTYTILQIVDSTKSGGSGLEHQNSHVDILAPELVGAPVLISLYAHEIFHVWNVKRLRPADLVPYRYDRPQPTPWLWVSEGVTDYYADLAQVRGGTVTARGFYELLTEKAVEVTASVPTALEDASLSAWIRPRDGTEYLYYPKGALAGLLLDIMIRDASDNASSLDHVMRELYQTTYLKGKGFTAEEWWGSIARAAKGKSFADFHTRYVDGRELFPWDSVLPLAGLRMGGDEQREPRLGITTTQDSSGLYVTQPLEGGPALPAGLESGDLLVAVAGIRVSDPLWLQKFRARYARASEGTEVPVRIRRGARDQTVRVQLGFVTRVDPRIVEDPRASAKALRIREGLLHGTTRP
ncbi:MAG: PDZ domain-containing protein [Gemmatimonadota bacterium]|nr:PDZ domain-containing protein [Gemmatimonadota bacterium]